MFTQNKMQTEQNFAKITRKGSKRTSVDQSQQSVSCSQLVDIAFFCHMTIEQQNSRDVFK